MLQCICASLAFVLFLCEFAISQAPVAPAESISSSAGLAGIRKKAEAGLPGAEFDLGRAYETGKGVPKDDAQAALWYRKSADQGNSKAQTSLGGLYWLGEGVDQDRKQALEWYHKAARQGDADAMFNLGAASYNGEGVSANEVQAQAWFLLSSDAGSAAGRDAVKRLEAERGSRGLADAYIAIGEMYEKGEDIPQNSQLAIAWYKKVANGDPGLSQNEAEARLATIYLRTENYTEARPWCEVAAKNGMRGSEFCMGYLYQHGLSVKQDPKVALKWYEQAAMRGHTGAMYALGEMYESGEGVKIDRVKAMGFFLSAGRLGDDKAVVAARELRPSMSDDEWKAAAEKLRNGGFDPDKVDAYLHRGSGQAAH